ncbi:hypothetical protein [Curtobacterium sp. RRHDQ10]|uniref:hypothetical protein n=1 Tax=Curtobacterium phyllosphaerae TaxID=3413379 RepID=UPI003BF25225
MSASGAVARATSLTLRRHIVRSLGGTGPAIAALTAIGVVALVTNVLLLQFSRAHFAVAFDAGHDSGPAMAAARRALVDAQLMTAPIVGLGMLVVTPPTSRMRPAARSAGAPVPAVVVGEALPFVMAIAVVAGLGGAGPTWFVASSNDAPVVAFLVLSATAVGAALAAVAAHALVVTGLRAMSVTPVLARLVALLVAFGSVGALLADLLDATMGSRDGLVAHALAVVWGPDGALGGRALLGGLVLVAGSVVVLVGARLLERDDGVFPRTPRIVGLRTIGAPNSFANAVLRETLMLLRHPVGQATTAAALVLGVLLVGMVGRGLLPGGAALSACAVLFSANAETSYGRSAGWRWVRVTSGVRPLRTVVEQYTGVLPIGLVLTAVAVVVIAPHDPGVVVATLVTFATMSASAYLAGTLLPFDDAVPTAVVATSLVTLTIEAVVLWGVSSIAAPGTPWSSCVELVVLGVALALAVAVVRRRG